jgi:hypothetical protein
VTAGPAGRFVEQQQTFSACEKASRT